MIAILSRTYTPFFTKGILLAIDDAHVIFHCVTLELPDNGNQKNVSCIPEGRYWCEKIISPTKGKCFLLKKVPGRSAIEIHVGNYAAGLKPDTQGCILPGKRFDDINEDGYIDVQSSGDTMKSLLSFLPNKFEILITS